MFCSPICRYWPCINCKLKHLQMLNQWNCNFRNWLRLKIQHGTQQKHTHTFLTQNCFVSKVASFGCIVSRLHCDHCLLAYGYSQFWKFKHCMNCWMITKSKKRGWGTTATTSTITTTGKKQKETHIQGNGTIVIFIFLCRTVIVRKHLKALIPFEIRTQIRSHNPKWKWCIEKRK